MLATSDADRLDQDGLLERISFRDVRSAPIERHAYQPPGSNRIFGGIGTVSVCSMIAVGMMVTLSELVHPKPAPTPLTVMMLPSTPEPPAPPRPDRPKPTQKPMAVIMPRPIVALPSAPSPVVVAPPPIVEPRPVPPEAKPAPATPPAERANHGPDKWEARVLAHIERFRRYPNDAHRARHQGTAFVRFRIDRDGHILSASLQQSSGFPELDEAALDTLRRADPLPKVPADRPDQLELLVPVEFFLRG